jgi:hypothetical protein
VTEKVTGLSTAFIAANSAEKALFLGARKVVGAGIFFTYLS